MTKAQKAGTQGTTLRQFADALRRIAAKKPFAKITVREISSASGLSTRSFYNHFRSKYDLVLWSYANADNIYLTDAESATAILPFDELLLLGLNRLSADRNLFKGAFNDWAGPESLCMTLVEHGCRAVPEYIRIRHGSKAVTERVIALVRFYVEGTVSELARWMADANPMPAKEFRDLLMDAMPPSIHKLLNSQPTTRKGKRK